MKLILRIVIIYLLISITACTGTSEESLMKKGVDFAERTFKATHTNELARLAFYSNMETGGSLITIVAANAPDDAKLPKYFLDKAQEKWSVVLRQDDETTDIIIEGIGEDLDKPVITKRVSLPEVKR